MDHQPNISTFLGLGIGTIGTYCVPVINRVECLQQDSDFGFAPLSPWRDTTNIFFGVLRSKIPTRPRETLCIDGPH